MEIKRLSEKVNEIEMPIEMRKRIIRNCVYKKEEYTMRKSNIFTRKPIVALASLSLFVCLTSVSVLAATGKLNGFFKDIKRWDGAVIGTSYEQATDELRLSIIEISDSITIMVEAINPENFPYREIESLSIVDYKIVDMSNKEIESHAITNSVDFTDGKAIIKLSTDKLERGAYKLVVNQFIGSKKADGQLAIIGNWEYKFSCE